MYPANTPTSHPDVDNTPLARIDAQNVSFAEALREYLQLNGCRVRINTEEGVSATYHIVIGEIRFVKDIFDAAKNTQMRSMGIVTDAQPKEAATLASERTKIILADPAIPTGTDVEDIFSFFFADPDSFVDKRRSRHEPIRSVPTISDDKERIHSIMIDLFGDDARHHSRNKKFLPHGRLSVKRLLAGLSIAVIVALLPAAWYGISLMTAGFSYGFAAKEYSRGNRESGKKFNRFGTYWVAQSKTSFALLRPPLTALGKHSFVRSHERFISFLDDVSRTYTVAGDVMEKGQDVVTLLFSSQDKTPGRSPLAATEALHRTVGDAQTTFALAQAQLTQLVTDRAFPFTLPAVEKKSREVLADFRLIRAGLATLNQLLTLYPRVSGFTKPATYLILLQNSNELRPTGGFIGSIARVTFEGGIMTEYAVRDVYALDGQLKGHVDPPEPIRDLLSQEHWYMRDSNWNPDFSVSGQKAAWFYEKETGESVDGVAAISLPLVIDLLRITGPLTLTDYQERITAENFFGKSFYYTQEGFFPGSTQKSDFLGSLSRTLLTTVLGGGVKHPEQLFQAVADSLQNRNLQLYFLNPELEQLVRQYRWAGVFLDRTGCAGIGTAGCSRDPLALVDANMAVSKINYFIKKEAVRELVFGEDGSLTETVSLTVQNTADTIERGVSGPYVSYLRLYLPQDASVDRVMINGQAVPGKKSAVSGPQPLPYLENVLNNNGLRSVAVAWEIPMSSTATLQAVYRRPHVVDTRLPQVFVDIMDDKQAGAPDLPLSIRVRFPASWTLTGQSQKIGITEPVVAKDGNLEYNTILSHDESFILNITL